MRTNFVILSAVLLSFSAQAKSLCGRFDRELKPIAKRLKAAHANGRWKQYEKFLKKYQSCMDGGYAESMQDASQEGLANDWAGFVHYATKENADPATEQRMEGGFSLTMGDPDLLKKIQANAAKNCPEQLAKFCEKIKSAPLGQTSSATPAANSPASPATDTPAKPADAPAKPADTPAKPEDDATKPANPAAAEKAAQ